MDIKFALKNAKTFEISCNYNANLVSMFKTIKSRMYDPMTKKWAFSLNDYEEINLKLSQFNLKSELLPQFVLKCFQNDFSVQKNWYFNQDDDIIETYLTTQDIPLIFEKIDPYLVSSLLPFQKEGIKLGIEKFHGKLLLADDMGLGKTIQALGITHFYKSDWPLLIVCPSSVRYHWAEAIRTWLPSVPFNSILVISPNNSHKSEMDIADSDDIDGCKKFAITITSYEWLVKHIPLKDSQKTAKSIKKKIDFLIKSWRSIILDESHFIKSYKSVRCKAAMYVVKNCKRVILCSGTPALSRPMELYTQIRAVNKLLFPNAHEFGCRYCDAQRNGFGWNYTGSSNMNELQIILEHKVMIRRMKGDVLNELPRKDRVMIMLDPINVHEDSQSSLKQAEKYLQSPKLKGIEHQGALLHYFRQTAIVKSQSVIKYLRNFLVKINDHEGDEEDKDSCYLKDGKCEGKIIIFAHHKSMIQAIATFLQQMSIDYILIDGSTKSEIRKLECDKFQGKPKCRVALLSITAANSGINLTAANYVLFAELFWNPGILVQAEDRAYRIGQKRDVQVQYLVSKNTSDDVIWPLIQAKLKVLKGAGLANEDFSDSYTKESSTLTKSGLSSTSQTCILDFWEKMPKDDIDKFMQDIDFKELLQQKIPSS